MPKMAPDSCCPNVEVDRQMVGEWVAIEPLCDLDVFVPLNFNGYGWSGEVGDLIMSYVCEGVDENGLGLMRAFASFGTCGSGSSLWHGCPPFPVTMGIEMAEYCCPISPGAAIVMGPGSYVPNGTPPRAPKPCLPQPGQCCPLPGGGGPDGGPGGGGGCGSGPASPGGSCGPLVCSPTTFSCQPIRYATGELAYTVQDIAVDGFGLPWGHTRSFASRLSVSGCLGNGYNWQVHEWPYLVFQRNPTPEHPDTVTSVAVMGNPNEVLWFDKIGNAFVPAFNSRETLIHDAEAGVYRLTDLDGTVTEFDDVSHMFQSRTAPGGARIAVTQLANNGFNFTDIERTYTQAGSTTTEQFHYEYTSDYLLTSVTLRRKVDAGAWTNISRVTYAYYGAGEAYGMEDDLKTATTHTWQDSAWSATGTSYYRYELDPNFGPGSSSGSATPSSGLSSSSSSGFVIRPPLVHRIKYILNDDAYARLQNDPSVTDPLTASDAIVALYADFYFEYDDQNRVTKEMVQGASQTFLFSYSESTHADGYNSWKYKTVETLPDGNQTIVYANFAHQTMLSVLKAGSDEWAEFYKYDENAQVVLYAAASALSGYDEQYADLLHEQSGNYEFMKDDTGLVRSYQYHQPTGYTAAGFIQQGEFGCPIKLVERTYIAHQPTGGSSSSSSSSGANSDLVYFLSQDISYPDAVDDPGNASSSSCGPLNQRAVVTSYSYTWYAGTSQIQQVTTTLPVVSTDQNGSGVAATRKDYFNEYGNRTWRMDERGFIARQKFDIPTGALTQQIQDVDTSVETDAPAGWTTPSGGGLNLINDFEHDDQGRITQSLGPAHSIDLDGTPTTIRRATWIVYDNTDPAQSIVRRGQGYATGDSPDYTYTLVNPVSITITDKNGNRLEQIQATRGSTSGKLLPSDTFDQSSYTRWQTRQYTDCCHLASERTYFNIPASGSGTEGTNYNQTDFGYDVRKRRNRSVTPGGTITRTVFDARGLVVSTWVGTDDTGATSTDPTGGGATGNNMVVITANVYDGGSDGGDGNLTQQTQYVTSSDTRVTSFAYDFRNRRIDTDGEINFFQRSYYDNIDRVIKTERYDTDINGNLVARQETRYDDRGRTYQTIRYGVDPATGTVGNSLTDNTWYDPIGQVIKSLPAGSKLFTKNVYDGLGRTTTVYRGYDLDESTYADASTIDGDTILEQSETTYDDGGNVLTSLARQRYHNAPASQTGALQNPTTTPKARVTYQASYADPLGRNVATANYGTNGGTALSRSSTIPARSDNVLVTSITFDSAGNMQDVTDPAGKVTHTDHDDLGREIRKIMNYLNGSSSSSSAGSSGSGCPTSIDENITVETGYTADGNVASITAVNSITGNQTTQYVYGTTLSDSGIATSTLKRAEIYPDSVDASDRITFEYDRQRTLTKLTDQAGTIHAYQYDKLGRQTQDRIIDLGTGVDGTVRRIAMTYDVRGMREHLTSYDDATVGAGSIVNDVQFAYNDFGQLITDYQSHSGAVNTSTSPKVQYAYADGSTNTVRPTSLTYPDGRVVTYDYGTTDEIDDAAARVAAIIDDDDTHLVDYSYLGAGTAAQSVGSPFGMGFVVADSTQPDIKWTLADLTGTNDPDTGDIYSGWDRFGRVKDNRWYDYGSSADVDRIKYGYDRVGNRVWRQNTVAESLGKHFDELYGYDDINRLADLDRGDLTAPKDAITDLAFAECWSLDETGNWKNFRQDDDGNGTWDLNQNRSANTVNEITDISESAGPGWVTPTYNPAGNMTTLPQPADPTTSYTATYDAWNRLIKLVDDSTSDTVSAYAYDGAKRRILQATYAGGILDQTRHLYYTEPSKWQVVEERVDSSAVAERQFVWGLRYIDDILLRDRDTTGNGTLDERLYGLQDANWNVTGVADATGSILERYAYSAYGMPTFLDASFVSRASSNYAWETLYAGYRFEASTLLFHVRHRILHVTLGTWLQRDPLGLSAGINLYNYAAGAPGFWTDASGQFLTVTTVVIIVIIIFVVTVSWVGCNLVRSGKAKLTSKPCVPGSGTLKEGGDLIQSCGFGTEFMEIQDMMSDGRFQCSDDPSVCGSTASTYLKIQSVILNPTCYTAGDVAMQLLGEWQRQKPEKVPNGDICGQMDRFEACLKQKNVPLSGKWKHPECVNKPVSD